MYTFSKKNFVFFPLVMEMDLGDWGAWYKNTIQEQMNRVQGKPLVCYFSKSCKLNSNPFMPNLEILMFCSKS